MRGLIADNTDEYINGSDGYGGARPYMQTAEDQAGGAYYPLNQAITEAQELSNDLPYSVITTLNALGAYADNETTMRSMGLAPNFSPAYLANVGSMSQNGYSSGVGVGAHTSFGGNSGQTISYSPLSNASFGVTAGAGIGVSALSGYYANSSRSGSLVSTSPYYSSMDPLGAIYGSNVAKTSAYNADAYRYVEGLGDPSYGYSSPYGGVGYGRAGYGDMGGRGFGTGSASGDPGFLKPESVVASGNLLVSRPRYDMSALTPGPTIGGTSGGAFTQVGGKSSGFSLVALEGTLADWAVTAARAESPLYGQQAAGPGFNGNYQRDIGYGMANRANFPTPVPYVGGTRSSVVNLASSLGFF